MSSISQVTTFADLVEDLQNRVRVTTGITATSNVAKRYVNTALQDIALATDYKLPWLERRAVLRTHAPYSDGTVAITVGSAAVTGTGSAWNTNNSYGETNARVTGKMIFDSGFDIYRVSVVGGNSTITLTDPYVDTAALTTASYTYFEDEYALASDFLRPLDFQMFSSDWGLPLISRLEFRRRYARPDVSGRPRVACILDLGFSGSAIPIRRVQLAPYPDQTYLIPYSYVTANLAVSSSGGELTGMISDDDQPNMPLRYRHLIVLHALMNWYRDKRDDTRSQEVKAEYTDSMLRLLSDQEIGTHMKAAIQPKVGVYQNYATRPYGRLGGTRWDIDDEFDRLDR